MAQLVQPVDPELGSYRGISNIFQFTNWDGELTTWNCGQAAAATLLTFQGIFAPDVDRAQEVMHGLEQEFPPDIVGGWFGTSRRQVEKICRRYGYPLEDISGEESLRDNLDRSRPVLVMLSVPGPRLFGRITLPAGHWMVAYGYDAEHVYLTNMGRMSWPDFRNGWDSFVPRAISMKETGLIVESK